MTEYQRRRKEDAKLAYKAFIAHYPLTLKDLLGEIWLPLSKNYRLSNFGRLKGFYHRQPKIIKPQLVGLYLGYDLSIGGKRCHRHVHRLVAELFIPNPEHKPEVNHKFGMKFDNYVENLEWVTSSENNRHAVATGLKNSGEDNYLASLTNEQVRWLRAVYKPHDKEYGAAALARKLNKSEQVIRLAVRGKHYKKA